MTNRILLGERAGAFGMWISKPGKDVLIAGNDDLMFSTNARQGQIAQFGVFAIPSTGNFPLTITHQNFGYYPLVQWVSYGYAAIYLQYLSLTQFRFNLNTNSVPQQGSASQRFIRYRIFAQPANV